MEIGCEILIHNTKIIRYNKITIYSTVKDSKEALNDERKRQKR